MMLIPVKDQPDGSNVRKILLNSSCHTPKTFQAIHIYFTKNKKGSRWTFYSSLLCFGNHPNIWWFIFTKDIQASLIQYQCLRVSTT